MNSTLRKVINLLALALVLTINYLANSLPINGVTAGDISDRYPVYFTPAGYVFSIWGLIYLGLIIFGIYQLLPRSNRSRNIDRITPWFVGSCILNSAWIFAWHYLYIGIALGIIVLLLVNLAAIYWILNQEKRGVPQDEKIFVKAVFSIYLAWISVATIANVFILFDYMNWNDWLFSEGIWTVLLIAIGTLLALVFVRYYRDFLFAAVFVWAFIGISMENNSGTLLFRVLPLVAAALIVIGALIMKLTEKQLRYF